MEAIFSSFLEGLLSFLSPCVLPLVPLYMAYLGGEDKDKKKTFIRTLFFVLGIFTVIVLLAISIDSIKDYIEDYKDIIGLVGSVIIIFFGLHETGLINISFLNKELKFKIDLKLNNINILKAYLFGFFFSLAWSPCIGPMLTSAIITSLTSVSGVMCLIGYGLGLCIPFLICGLLTNTVLSLINRYKKITKYILIASGIILIVFGLYLGYTSSKNIIDTKESLEKEIADLKENNEKIDSQYTYLPSSEFKDALGNSYYFKDYQGKYIYLNFTATWCGYCKEEIIDYIAFAESHEDVACFYVMNAEVNGGTLEDIKQYIEDNNVTIPIIVDSDYVLFNTFGADGFPTMWAFGPDLSLIGYQAGALTLEYFNSIHATVQSMFNER